LPKAQGAKPGVATVVAGGCCARTKARLRVTVAAPQWLPSPALHEMTQGPGEALGLVALESGSERGSCGCGAERSEP
jgi:hypothetical protein